MQAWPFDWALGEYLPHLIKEALIGFIRVGLKVWRIIQLIKHCFFFTQQIAIVRKNSNSQFLRINKAVADTIGAPSIQSAVGKDDLDYFNVITYTKLLASTIISLRTSPKELGMRPETAESIQQQAPILDTLSRRIQNITGLSIPEVETALSQIG